MPLLRLLLLFLIAALLQGPALGQTVKNFCAATKGQLSRDEALRAAANAAFPNADYAPRDDDCIYPFALLRYGDADALIVIGNKPGEACHGFSANMSAYVLRRRPGRPVVVARFVDFAATGTFRDPGQIDAIQLAGHDAFAVEAGGTFQGYSGTSVSFFFFDGGRIVELKPSLPLSASNEGAVGDRKGISVDGSWRVEPGRGNAIDIAYKVTARGRERRAAATWFVEGNTLSLKSGKVPTEYAIASGG